MVGLAALTDFHFISLKNNLQNDDDDVKGARASLINSLMIALLLIFLCLIV